MPNLQIFNPATSELIKSIPCDDQQSLAHKIKRAKGAQKEYAATPISQRIQWASRFRELLLAEIQRLAHDLSLETGKPITQSRNEVRAAISRIDFFIENSARVLAQQDLSIPNTPYQESLSRVPLGIVANISAWNYPYLVGVNVFIPALLAGNAILYKPSEFASITGLNIVQLLHRSGFPQEIIAPVIGTGEIGASLLDMQIDGVFFTGSLVTGKEILRHLRERMIPVQLELGGKDGVYVCEDANLAYSVPSLAEGAFYNTGQSCCSVERIFVHKDIYDQFKTQLIAEVESYVLGDPMDEKTFIGPLTRPQQPDFISDQIARSISLGARVLVGGQKTSTKGNFFEPTIIECDNFNAPIINEESFGPIVTLTKVKDDDESIRWLNNTDFGLTGGVYSASQERAKTILDRLDAGTVYWNSCDRVSPRLPWSGVKNSGLGATLGDEGIRCFTRPKAWQLYQIP